MNHTSYPWFILLPNRKDITEIHHLPTTDQQQLLKESMFFCQCLEQVFRPDKINLASLGNVVPQLHIHHIARYINDPCWPAPVWGAVPAVPYKNAELQNIKQKLASWFERNNDQSFRWAGTYMDR
jgi:diadenosine tetraphosphate (Ap4A) HIT family hydrolase